ncbi:hypothetical protein [Campylobacter fetus]
MEGVAKLEKYAIRNAFFEAVKASTKKQRS